jgi:hypothetical protein
MHWWKRPNNLPSSDGQPKKASSGEDSTSLSTVHALKRHQETAL